MAKLGKKERERKKRQAEAGDGAGAVAGSAPPTQLPPPKAKRTTDDAVPPPPKKAKKAKAAEPVDTVDGAAVAESVAAPRPARRRGKKHRPETVAVAPSPDEYYAEDAVGFGDESGAAAAAAAPDRAPPPRLDADTLAYFTQVGEMLLTADGESKAALASRALDEAAKCPAAAAADAVGGRTLQSILPFAPPAAVASLLSSLGGDGFVGWAVHPGASHVAESLLARMDTLCRPFDSDASADAAARAMRPHLSVMVASCSASALELTLGRYGSHTLRSLMKLLAGRELGGGGGGGGLAGRTMVSRVGSVTTAAVGVNGLTPPPLAHPTELMSLVRCVLIAAGPRLRDAAFEPGASCVLQMCAEVVALADPGDGDDDDSDASTLLVRRRDLGPLLLGAPRGCDASPGDRLAGADAEFITSALRDRAASHLLEAVVRHGGAATASEFGSRFVAGRAAALARCPSANFVVQATLGAMCTGAGTPSDAEVATVTTLAAELLPLSGALMASARGGVVAALAAAVGRTGDAGLMRSAAAGIARGASAIAAGSPTGSGLSPDAPKGLAAAALLTLGTPFNACAPTPGRLSPLGCVIAVTVLAYAGSAARPILDALLADPTDVSGGGAVGRGLSLSTIARDAGGARVCEAILTSPAGGAPAAKKLIKGLSGSYAALAAQPAGAYLLEACLGAAATRSARESIIAELAAAPPGVAASITRSRHGPALWSRLGVAAYTSSPEAWRQREASHRATRAAFAGMLADPAAGGAAGDAGEMDALFGRGKKAKKRGAQGIVSAQNTP